MIYLLIAIVLPPGDISTAHI